MRVPLRSFSRSMFSTRTYPCFARTETKKPEWISLLVILEYGCKEKENYGDDTNCDQEMHFIPLLEKLCGLGASRPEQALPPRVDSGKLPASFFSIRQPVIYSILRDG